MSQGVLLGPPYLGYESCFGWRFLSVPATACLPLPQSPSQELTSPFTSVCLSVGEDRARTRSLGQILSSFSCSTCQYQNIPGSVKLRTAIQENLSFPYTPSCWKIWYSMVQGECEPGLQCRRSSRLSLQGQIHWWWPFRPCSPPSSLPGSQSPIS